MKRIQLTESQLHQIIKEAVKKVINNEQINEISLSTMNSAYKKMADKGQDYRAKRLIWTAEDGAINRDDALIPNIKNNTAYISNGNEPYNFKQSHPKYNGENDTFYDSRGIEPQNTDTPRYDNPVMAKKMEKNIRQLNPNTKFDKNDFRR